MPSEHPGSVRNRERPSRDLFGPRQPQNCRSPSRQRQEGYGSNQSAGGTTRDHCVSLSLRTESATHVSQQPYPNAYSELAISLLPRRLRAFSTSSTILGLSRRCFVFLLPVGANFSQEGFDGLFAAQELLDRDINVARITGLVDFMP